MMQGASIFHLARGLHRAEVLHDPRHRSTPPGSRPTSGSSASRTLSTSPRPASRRSPSSTGHSVERARVARRGDLRRGDGRTGSGRARGRWPRCTSTPGQRVWLVTAAPVEIAPDHRPPARADRRAGHGRRSTRTASTPAGWSARCCTARPRRRRCRPSPSARGSTWPVARRTATRHNDIPMLSLVGDPCAINPDPRLRDARPGARLADPRLPHRPEGRPGRAGRRGSGRGRHRESSPRVHSRSPPVGCRSVEDGAAPHQQRVQGLLDRLADLVGDVEHQHRVVGRRRRRSRCGSARRTR